MTEEQLKELDKKWKNSRVRKILQKKNRVEALQEAEQHLYHGTLMTHCLRHDPKINELRKSAIEYKKRVSTLVHKEKVELNKLIGKPMPSEDYDEFVRRNYGDE